MNQMTNSHILLHRFDYHEPASLDEAVALLAQYGGAARVLAGGTDLLVHIKMERAHPAALISLACIPCLTGIENQAGALRIGSSATIAETGRSLWVRTAYHALADACAAFSTTQVQVMGTVGGNLGNGSPASDTAPALIALGAEIVLHGPTGTRTLPLEDFFLGPGKTALDSAEVITSIMLPHPQGGTGSAFAKASRVAADIAKASAAVRLVRAGSRVTGCRMAFGSVAPVPLRTRGAEQLLIGQTFSQALAEEAAVQAAQEIAPIDDVRSTAAYRREVVKALAFDALETAWQRAARSSVASPVWELQTTAANGIGRAPASALGAGEKRWIPLRVNGREHNVYVAANDLLLNVLREQMQLTGTKYGCGIGECSACTVLMDGTPVLACLVLAVAAVGHDILTVEGLAGPGGELDPLQDAFIEHAAYQCGYCTPGMLLTAKSLLNETPHPSEDDVRHYLRGNLCRCTGYASIVRAVMAAHEQPSGTENDGS